MATLVLGVAGAAAGAAILPAGVSVLGATIGGAVIGRAVGSIGGAFIDQALFGATGQAEARGGPKLSDTEITASTEGAPIPRLYGRARIGGQLIWATNLEEVVSNQSSGGGKGLSGGGGASGKKFLYFANFAVGLTEGEISRIGRVWADGDEIDLSKFTHRVYTGTETQTVDSLIEAKEGTDNAPAYRGTAYIVFERMPLEDFGNRIPQLNFEVFRPLDDFLSKIEAVCIIPAASEFAYEPTLEFAREIGAGKWQQINKNTNQSGVDWDVSISDLENTARNISSANLFVTWFGSDLRCDKCEVRPKVALKNTVTHPTGWRVEGLGRNNNKIGLISQTPGGDKAFGSTPHDTSVRDALVDLQDRGIKAVMTPFLLMDIPASNTLTDPYDGSSSQPEYPWRGRITCDPAPGETGTADQTATAKTQIDAFLGNAAVSDFFLNANNKVRYTGPNEWSYRRFILHYAHLCKAAEAISGTPVDVFVIGTEQPFLTLVRDDNDDFPFVDGLVTLAADVKSVLPNTKVTYAADWTEIAPYQTSKFGGPAGEIFFHLDKLWADSNIDAIGIDNYWPLADWRDGTSHLDWQAGTRTIYDPGLPARQYRGRRGL